MKRNVREKIVDLLIDHMLKMIICASLTSEWHHCH